MLHWLNEISLIRHWPWKNRTNIESLSFQTEATASCVYRCFLPTMSAIKVKIIIFIEYYFYKLEHFRSTLFVSSSHTSFGGACVVIKNAGSMQTWISCHRYATKVIRKYWKVENNAKCQKMLSLDLVLIGHNFIGTRELNRTV